MTEQRYVVQNKNGVRRTYIYDDDDPDKVVVQVEQDIEEILDGVNRDREIMLNDGDNKYLGKVPVAVFERAAHQQWDESDWRRWWNGQGPSDLPSGRLFRVWRPGGWI